MTGNFIDRWINQGVQQGVQQGLQQGEASFALRLLRQRFGALGAETESCVKNLLVETLEKLGDALLSLQNPDALATWLKTHAPDTEDLSN
jgi:hypothetical protein